MSDISYGSGNVFEDLGFLDAGERLLKADLASNIASVIEQRGLTPAEAWHITGEPEISQISRGRLSEFGLTRLCRILNGLGVSVSLILVDEPNWRPGETAVRDKKARQSGDGSSA